MGSSHLLPDDLVDPHSDGAPPPVPAEGPVGSPDDATVISQPQGVDSSLRRPLSPMELGKQLAGERLGHFELLEYAGGGGMGAVFRARDTMLNREVALKVLSRDQAADDENRRRFQNEAQSAARLDHENIARVYYVGEDRGVNYIVFEFIDGVNVRELVMRRGPLPVDEVVSYMLQLADALAHASSRDVVHRDIKPSNILITPQGRAKLVDMGLARLHQVRPGMEDLTASGVTLGTFDYISPEQARDPRSADVRSDIYSLGCTLYFMLTGRPPFPEGTVLQKLLQHNSDEPPDPREFQPDLPEGVSTIIRKMLAKDPRRRYQTPAELITDLLVLADEVGAPTPGNRAMVWTPTVEAPAWFERHLPWALPLLGIVVLGAVLQWIRPASNDAPPPRLPLNGGGVVANLPSASVEVAPPQDAPTPPENPPPTTTVEAPPVPPDAPETVVPTAAAGQPDEPRPDLAGPQMPTPAAVDPSGPEPPAAEGPAVETPRQPVPAAPLPDWLLVVGNGTGPRHYATLRAAVSEAKDGDVIELRYNGRMASRPFAVNVARLTIRAGEGYQPVVVFQPDDADIVATPRGMISIPMGHLTLARLGLEMRVPTPYVAPSERWSVIELAGAESLRLDRCSVTVLNATEDGASYHPAVAAVSLHAPTGQESMMMQDGPLVFDPTEIHLADCVVRGETALLRVYDMQPARLEWNNGLLVASDPLVCTTGGFDNTGARVDVILRHVTAALRGWAFEATNSYELPVPPLVAVTCSDSVLLSKRGAPLVENVGVVGMNEFQQWFEWNGDRVYYEGFDRDAFWRFVDHDAFDMPLRQMTFDQWKDYWGTQREVAPNWGSIIWRRLPPASRPAHATQVEDYLLADEQTGIGMDANQLPWLPAPDERPEADNIFPGGAFPDGGPEPAAP